MTRLPDEPSSVFAHRNRPTKHTSWSYVGLFFICLILFELLGVWPASLVQAQAVKLPAPAQTHNTAKTFLAQSASTKGGSHTPLLRPKNDTGVPLTAKAKAAAAKPLPSAEPATMRNQAYTLDSSFLLNHASAPATSAKSTASKVALALTPATIPAGTAPFTFSSSDGRLSLSLPRAAVDLTHATIDGNTAPVGTLTLQISQISGNSSAESSILGTYRLLVVDSQGHEVHGLALRSPMTISYHYTPQELAGLNINPNEVILAWPQMLANAAKAKQSGKAYQQRMTNNATTHTVSTQVSTLGMGPLTAGASPEIQSPPAPHVASVSGNAGQLSYDYPLSVVPGVGGFAPKLDLTYSSESTNERYSRRAPAGAEGDGWSLGLGSISVQQYPTGSTSAGTWYFLNGVDNVSDRLVPSSTSGNTTYYATEHLSYLRISFDGTCFHLWDRNGYYYGKVGFQRGTEMPFSESPLPNRT